MDRRASVCLANIPEGREVLVTSVTGTGSATLRLRELGLCEGRTVTVDCPGDPMICTIDQCRVGLAKCLAEQVQVRHLSN